LTYPYLLISLPYTLLKIIIFALQYMNSISQIRQNTLSHFKERIYIICALLLISCLILIDILHEVYSGVKFEDLAETAFIEGSILATTFITVAYILRLFNKEKLLK